MAKPAAISIPNLGQALLHFVGGLDDFDQPADVLDGLHKITAEHCELNVMAAVMLPFKAGKVDELDNGSTVFVHPSVPKAWWKDYSEFSQKQPGLGFMLAQLSIAPFTASEMLRISQPLGIDRWSMDLALKYGIRDGLTCPVGGRWIVVYWSATVLDERLSQEIRAMLFMGATFAAIRLQQLVGSTDRRPGQAASLTQRELAVLRLLSFGHPTREVAELLGIGEETVRSHLKKAQAKLGARNRTQAVAQALRQYLIP